jgi:DNA helicase-2/ATP-dependent DNA helicase PcrA
LARREVGNILRFEQDFPGAEIIRLERNYRSTGHILAAASGVIAHNRTRHGKTLWTEDDPGEQVRVVGLWDDQEEARYVADSVEGWQREGGHLSHCAVLVRAGFQTRAFEERFIQVGLPYRVIGGPRFYERAEIRDAIAYFRCVCQPEDDLAFERIVNLPRRGVGDTTLKAMRAASRSAETSLLQAARALSQTDELPGKARSGLRELVQALDRWRALLPEKPPRDVAETVLEESGYTEMWRADRSPDATGRLENLKELVKAVQEFDTLPGFLEHISLVMDNAADAGADLVSIMTLHGAKGLEFDHVFLSGWEEGLFPSQRSIDEGGTKALEEERRLAYVGITRARRRLTISFAANRRVYNQWQSSVPSRFVEELPADHIQHLHRETAAGGSRRFGLDPFADMVDAAAEPVFTARPSRFRSRRLDLGKTLDGKAELLGTRPMGKTNAFKAGDRIFHDKFGYGRIEGVDGDKLDIAFERAGQEEGDRGFVRRRRRGPGEDAPSDPPSRREVGEGGGGSGVPAASTLTPTPSREPRRRTR